MTRHWPFVVPQDRVPARRVRDATAFELRGEPEIVLRELADGRMGATATTSLLARAELDYRRLRGVN